MSMKQLLLFADPRPLVERLGVEFFRQAPQGAGVYLMRDSSEAVLYVGKAKNLRQRLAHYRVANPDRLRRRHLRLLHAVRRIDLEELLDEAAALAREAELLLSLRPPFNRAGTWKGPLRHLAWRVTQEALELAVLPEHEPGWTQHGPVVGAIRLRASLVRLLWCAIQQRSLVHIPAGWIGGRLPQISSLRWGQFDGMSELAQKLEAVWAGNEDPLIDWIAQRTAMQQHPLELAIREGDLEMVRGFALKRRAQ
jgi:hypothetical protein